MEFEKVQCMVFFLFFFVNHVNYLHSVLIKHTLFAPTFFAFDFKNLAETYRYDLTLVLIEGWAKESSCWPRYPLELQSH